MKYLDWYIADLSWREDRTRLGTGSQMSNMLVRTPLYPTSIASCNADDRLMEKAHSSGANSFLMK